MTLKKHWEDLDLFSKHKLLKENHFWVGLRDFPFLGGFKRLSLRVDTRTLKTN